MTISEDVWRHEAPHVLAALLLTGAMAAVTVSNHFLHLTVLPHLYADSRT